MADGARTREDLRITIMGAGPGGLCMAIKLREAGFENFTIVEKGDQIGGTWNWNRYPGCACDIPSHLYSFSFDVKPDWSRPYAPQPEILEYLEGIAEKYGILPFCRFGQGVERANWDDGTSTWTVTLADGSKLESDVLVSAIGMFNSIVMPDIPGLDEFEGTVFHSSRWDWEHSLEGETVGVIGSAASAVQLVPEIVKEAGQVHMFQRTANWVLPKEDDPYTEEQLEHFRNDPSAAAEVRQTIFDGIETGQAFYDRAVREETQKVVLDALAVVEDPEVREKLVPTHEWGCKRPLFSNDYYAAFNRENLELVTEGIERITKDGVVTADGRERRLDTLVLATGFSSIEYLSAISVTGRGGLDLEDAWSDGAVAYQGVTTSGFPNLFMLYGPNTNQGSLITMIEWEVDHAVDHIERIVEENLAWVDVRADLQAAYNEQMQKDIEAVEPWTDGCNNYYRHESGRVVTQWPKNMTAYRELISEIDPDAFETQKR
ncbi:MAG: NAD(P)/FAD-dependent oxidoreductase [bacterium]|nr:NAD(P)/FAD-dependent oxidoreductase [bacterium]